MIVHELGGINYGDLLSSGKRVQDDVSDQLTDLIDAYISFSWLRLNQAYIRIITSADTQTTMALIAEIEVPLATVEALRQSVSDGPFADPFRTDKQIRMVKAAGFQTVPEMLQRPLMTDNVGKRHVSSGLIAGRLRF
jgi:hypothetical protein